MARKTSSNSTWRTKLRRRQARRAAKPERLSATALRRRQRDLFITADAMNKVSDWFGDFPELQPQAMLPQFVSDIVAELEKLYMCTNGWKILEDIDDILTKHGANLSATDRKALEDSGARLWENLVAAGC